MKEIPLTQGKVALVDDEDYEWLIKWKWHYNDGYADRNEPYVTASGERKQKKIRMHREIMNAPEGMEVDHKDNQKLNNQRTNLRVCTRSQNQANKFYSINTSGFKGVAWHKICRKWQARININGKEVALGYFNDKIQAARAYNEAAIKYHGEFAKLNPI